MSKKSIIIAVGSFLAFLIFLNIQPFSYERIDAGHAGIKINLIGTDKGVSDVTSVTGIVFYNSWTTKIEEFPTFTQTADYEPFVVTTKDAAEFKVDPKVNYHVEAVNAPKIYRQYRRPLTEIQQGFMKNTIYDAYRIVANSYSSDSVMSHREGFEDKVQTVLTEKLGKGGFSFEQLTSALSPPPSLRHMIDQKNASIQARLKAENQALQARAEAEVLIATAEGEAKATLIKAKAEAEANRLKQSALTPMLIQQQWIDKWSGDVPSTQLGANTSVMYGLK